MVYHLPMTREDPQMKIRLPAELKERIETASKEAGRSMNSEIVTRLAASFHSGLFGRPEMEVLEQAASMLGLTPGTEKYKDTVEALATDIEDRLRKSVPNEVKSILEIAYMRRNAPDIFQEMLDAGVRAGLTYPGMPTSEERGKGSKQEPKS